jgi:hypothetical protein
LSVWGGEAIHDAVLGQLTSAPTGKKIAKLTFTWNGDGTIASLQAYDSGNTLLFTLTFTWNGDGTLQVVSRS